MSLSDVLVNIMRELNVGRQKLPPNEAQEAQLREILTNKSSDFNQRLMAAQLLARLPSFCSSDDTPSIIALLPNRTSEELLQFFATWCAYVEGHGFPVHGNGYEMFHYMLKELSKHEEIVFKKENRDTALFATLFYSEVNPGKEIAKCQSLFLKTFLRLMADKNEVFELLLSDVSPGTKSKYDLLASIVLSDDSVVNYVNLDHIQSELEEVAKSQEGSSTCVFFLSLLLQTVQRDLIIDWFVEVITTTDKSTRNNVHRSWITRLSANPALHSVLDEALKKCRSLFESIVDPIDFPPNEKEIHEWTCLDPYEGWEEDEDVYWPSDALLSTILLLVSLRQRGRADASLRDLLLRASRWHLEEIRFTSLQLLLKFTKLTDEEKNELIIRNLFVDDDNFVKELAKIEITSTGYVRGRLENALVMFAKEGHKVALQTLLRLNEEKGRPIVFELLISDDSDKRRVAYSARGALTPEERVFVLAHLLNSDCVNERVIDHVNWLPRTVGEEETIRQLHFMEMTGVGEDVINLAKLLLMNGSAKNAVEERATTWRKSDVKGWIKVAHLLPRLELASIMAKNAERIEDLLLFSGSNAKDECPSFTEFDENIRANGMEPKQFSDEMLTRLALLDHGCRLGVCAADDALVIVFGALLRCRYKAIVDQGATIFESLLKRDETLVTEYSDEINHLLDSPATQCRSLTLSRTLLACSALDPKLIEVIEDSFMSTYFIPVDQRPPLVRWLKTLKLFISKANETKITNKFIDGLFFVCIELQHLSADFLERSAAMCLYSFVVKRMVGPTTGTSLFALISARPDFTLKLFQTIQELPKLPRIATILICSFLSKLDYVSDGFYGEEWAQRVDEARNTMWSLLLLTGMKRERRFIVDAFLALTPHPDREELKDQFEYDKEEDGHQYLKESLTPRVLPSTNVVESRLQCSLYWRRVTEAVDRRSTEPLTLTLNMEYEQAAMAMGLGLALMGRKRRRDRRRETERERTGRVQAMEQLSRHPRTRVRGIAARLRDEWEGERKREERGAMIFY